MAALDTGNSSAGKANVSATYELEVNLPRVDTRAGFATMLAEVDDGTVTGTRYLLSPEVTDDFRLRMGIDQSVFNLGFEGTIIARDRLQQNDTTATSAQAGGYLTLNSGSSVTSGQGTNIRTWRTFPIFGSYSTYAEFWAREGNPTGTNAITEFGFGYVSAVTAQATDGVFFRRLSGGQLRLVNVNNSVDISTADITETNIPSRDGVGTYDPTESNHYVVSYSSDHVEAWINDTLVASIPCSSAYGFPTSSTSQPVFARVYNTGTASAARSLSIGCINVSQGEMNTGKPYGHVMAAQGGGIQNVQPGTTSGPTVTRGASATAGWPASTTASATGTWTATSAPAINTLGGSWVSPAMSGLTLEADYPVFQYLNPAGTATLPGKTLYITGIKVANTVALAAASTSNTNLVYVVAAGATAAGTAGTEGATAVAGRCVMTEVVPFKAAAAIGDYVPGSTMDLSAAPIAVYPGAYVQFIVRPTGAVTSNTLTVRGAISFFGYYE